MDNRGSILIWVILIGVGLLSVFTWQAMRLRANSDVQNSNTEQLNARAFLESYTDYLQNLPAAELEKVKGPISFEGITGTLTRETSEISSTLDFENEVTYNFGSSLTDIILRWNRCDGTNLKADMTVKTGSESVYTHQENTCPPNQPDLYNDETPLTVSGSFSLKAPSAPFVYAIVPATPGTLLQGNEWHLSLSMPVSPNLTMAGKTVTVSRTFK